MKVILMIRGLITFIIIGLCAFISLRLYLLVNTPIVNKVPEVKIIKLEKPSLKEEPPKKVSLPFKFETLQAGNGQTPEIGDRVFIRYIGYLETGEEFDSNINKLEPFEFILGYGQVIAGIDLLVKNMSKASIFKATFTPDLAYGESGVLGIIPANATLTYQVELVDFYSSGIPKQIPDILGLKELKLKDFSCYYLKEAQVESKKAKLNDWVSIDFIGWLPDGRVFDSSLGRGIPFQLRLDDKIIDGFNLLLPELNIEDRVLCVIPPKLAYKDRALPGIPKNSTLIFQIELLEILN